MIHLSINNEINAFFADYRIKSNEMSLKMAIFGHY